MCVCSGKTHRTPRAFWELAPWCFFVFFSRSSFFSFFLFLIGIRNQGFFFRRAPHGGILWVSKTHPRMRIRSVLWGLVPFVGGWSLFGVSRQKRYRKTAAERRSVSNSSKSKASLGLACGIFGARARAGFSGGRPSGGSEKTSHSGQRMGFLGHSLGNAMFFGGFSLGNGVLLLVKGWLPLFPTLSWPLEIQK